MIHNSSSSSRRSMFPTAALATLTLALMVCPSVQVCAPDCTGVDPGTSVGDPTDCTRYYVCIDASGTGELVPSSAPLDCPDGQYFNDAHTVPRCDPISGAAPGFCSDLCNPCKPHCTAPGEVTPHPTDCSTYYVCLDNGHILEVGCPENVPFFDFMSGECVMDETVCYEFCDLCVPHCTVDGERIPNPRDCTKFYLCSPPDIASFACPHNQVFNRETSKCEENAICEVDCPDTTDNPLI